MPKVGFSTDRTTATQVRRPRCVETGSSVTIHVHSVPKVTIAFAAPPAQCDPKAANPSNRRRFSFDYFDMPASSVHKWPPAPEDFEMTETNRFLLAAAVCLALTGTVG